MKALNRFLRDESGLETVEWAFVLGFVVLTAVLALVGARDSLSTIFTLMEDELVLAADGLGAGS
ncbi:MAG: Flp family type IVb pilin [Planctomycetota bacterium]